ncbi:MAG TPA: hypothetical protein VIC26_03960, partial [Marinagarivorans sp.]
MEPNCDTHAPAESNSDCEITIKSDFIDRYVKALNYPLEVDLSRGDTGSLDMRNVETLCDYAEHSPRSEEARDTIASDVLPAALQDARNHQDTDIGERDNDEHTSHTKPALPAQWVEIESLFLSVLAPPIIKLGPTIAVSDIKLKASAKFTLGFNWLGKRRSINVSLSDTEVDGQRAILDYSTDGDSVYILPQLESLYMTARVKVLKWRFNYRLNLTSTINKRLKSYGPIKVLSLSGLIQTPKAYGNIELPALLIQSLRFS